MFREAVKHVSEHTGVTVPTSLPRDFSLRARRSDGPCRAMKYRPRFTALLSATLLASTFATGCMIDDETASVGTTTQDAYTFNAYTFNAYTFNGAVWTDLVLAPLTGGDLPDSFVAALDDTTPIPDTNLSVSDYADMTLRYVYECAMPADATMTVLTPGGRQFDYKGSLGVAPSWGRPIVKTSTPIGTTSGTMLFSPIGPAGSCGQECQQWVSACVIARINAFGVKVPISVAGDNSALDRSAVEKVQFPLQEGAFFGDLMVDPPILYSCSGTSWTAERQLIEGSVAPYDYLHARICGHDNTNPCHVQYLGDCTDPCGQPNSFGYYNRCKAPDGTWYPQVVTTYMTNADLYDLSADGKPPNPTVTLANVSCWNGSAVISTLVRAVDAAYVATWHKYYRIGSGSWLPLSSTSLKVPSGQYLTVAAQACNSRGCSDYASSTIRASSCGGGIHIK